MKHTERPVLNLMLDLVSANAAHVPKEHAQFVSDVMYAAKRALARLSKAERDRAEREAAAAKAREPFNLGERARLRA
jgi:hypothetical protein